MNLSIVAVVIDNLSETKRFISSIRDHTDGDYELIIIDNESKDQETIDYIKHHADQYFRFDKIVCLSKAWNKGIELAQGNYIAVVNNDTVVPPNWYPPLQKIIDTEENVGMVSPLTYWNLKYNLDKNRLKSMYSPLQIQRFRQGVWGEFMVFPKEVLKDVDYFDESYLQASGEDVEMLYRLHEKNYKVFIEPRVFVFHQGGATGDKLFDQSKKNQIWERNWKQFLTKWKKYEDQILDKVDGIACDGFHH